MLHRSLMTLSIGIVLVGCLLLAGYPPGFGIGRDAAFARIELADVLRRELVNGMLGGVRCDALVGSLPLPVECGGWNSSAYDPDERCWYLTGWIDDERVDCRKMSLTLWPIIGSAGGRAWRFHLLCTSLLPAEPTCVEIEGAWRCGDGRIRIAWTGGEAGVEKGGSLQTCLIAIEPGRIQLPAHPMRLSGPSLSSGR